MVGLRVMHCVPGDLGRLPEWKRVIPHAATLGLDPLSSGNPIFNMIWISPFCKTTDAYTYNKGPRQGSLYASTDHFQVDPAFSAAPDLSNRKDMDERDLQAFCLEAGKAGIQVCADMVINHVASDHPMVIKEDNDLRAIKCWGKDLRLIVAYGRDNAPVAKSVHDILEGDSIIGISYDPAGSDAMPGVTTSQDRKTYMFKFVYDKDLNPIVDSSMGQNWSDVRKINYDCPSTRDEFAALWKQQIDWFIDLGFTGFRCDAAYKMDADLWSELVQHSYDRLSEKCNALDKPLVAPTWIAETLGGTWDDIKDNIGGARVTVNGQSQKAFDYGMIGKHWWDFKENYYIGQSNVLMEATRFGGLGVADNHDTPDVLASTYLKAAYHPTAVGDICFRDLAVSMTLGAAGLCMEWGYEQCLRQTSVFRDPQVFEEREIQRNSRDIDHPLNISRRIHAIVSYFEHLHTQNLTAEFDDRDFATLAGLNKQLMRYTLHLKDCTTGEKKGTMVVFVNEKPEKGPGLIDSRDVLDCDEDNTHRVILGAEHARTVEIPGKSRSFINIADLAIILDLAEAQPDNKAKVSLHVLPGRDGHDAPGMHPIII